MAARICSALATLENPLAERDCGLCCRNETDTGNGIETSSRSSPARTLGGRVGMRRIPETGLKGC